MKEYATRSKTGNLSRARNCYGLDDASQQKREIGIVAAALESATNEKNWNLVERLGLLLMKYRESQLKAKKDAETLVDMDRFRYSILNPLLDAITNRIKEALPDSYENIIDLIEQDLKGIHPRLQPQRLLEGPQHE